MVPEKSGQFPGCFSTTGLRGRIPSRRVEEFSGLTAECPQKSYIGKVSQLVKRFVDFFVKKQNSMGGLEESVF
jgi:hypothetical protein